MNRAERRRQQRHRISVGDNVVLTGLGERVSIDDLTMKPMPAKVSGRHRWVTMVTFWTPEPGAAGPKVMDQNNMLMASTGCIDCEQAWSPDLQDRPCGAPEFPWGNCE